MVEEWGIRKTKRFITDTLEKTQWSTGKISRASGNYHILYLNPKSGQGGHQTVISAIEAIHALQKKYVENFGRENAPKPRPVVASFVITPEESPAYPFRMNVVLPPWAFPDYIRMYGPKNSKEGDIRKAMSRKVSFMRVGNYFVPVGWFMKTDLRTKAPAEHIIESRGLPPHILGGNIHETAGIAALLAENTDMKVARNVFIAAPAKRYSRKRKSFGRILFEFDALATDGKNIHAMEVKSVGPRTIPRWEEIVLRKAQTMTLALEYLRQTLGPLAYRIFPHFVVVSSRESVSTELANAALKALKPHPSFARLTVHAVWPSNKYLLKRSLKEPLW